MSKLVSFSEFGPAHRVCNVHEAADPPPPGPGQVLVEVELFPINPVDLLTVAGRYATRPTLPATPGSEALGRVVEAGEGVEHVRDGDRVLLMGRENWAQRKIIAASEALPITVDADPRQLAMLKINPATALLMLTRYRQLEPGSWVLQNAANSGVGHYVIQLARARGLKTINVVRRPDVRGELEAAGADAVLVDGPELKSQVAEIAGSNLPALALDAVAGEATGRLAACLADGAAVVNYGLLSGQACQMDPFDVVFRRVDLTGFWLVAHLGKMEDAQRVAMYQDLAQEVARGQLHTRIERVYPLGAVRAALEHASRDGRSGKVLVAPNGDNAG